MTPWSFAVSLEDIQYLQQLKTYEALMWDEKFTRFLQYAMHKLSAYIPLDYTIDQLKDDANKANLVMYYLFAMVRYGLFKMENKNTKEDFLESSFYDILNMLRTHFNDQESFKDRLKWVLQELVRLWKIKDTKYTKYIRYWSNNDIQKIIDVYQDTKLLYRDIYRKDTYPHKDNDQYYIEHPKEMLRSILFLHPAPTKELILWILNHDTREEVSKEKLRQMYTTRHNEFSSYTQNKLWNAWEFAQYPLSVSEYIHKTQGHKQAFVMTKLSKPSHETYVSSDLDFSADDLDTYKQVTQQDISSSQKNENGIYAKIYRAASNMRNLDYTTHLTSLFHQLDSPDEIDHFLYYDKISLLPKKYMDYKLYPETYDRVSIEFILTIKIYDQLHNLRTLHRQEPKKISRKIQEIERVYLPMAEKLYPYIASLMKDTIQELRML